MTEAKLKAKEMVEELGLITALNKCKVMLDIQYQLLELSPTEANSNSFNYWGDIMDTLIDTEI